MGYAVAQTYHRVGDGRKEGFYDGPEYPMRPELAIGAVPGAGGGSGRGRGRRVHRG